MDGGVAQGELDFVSSPCVADNDDVIDLTVEEVPARPREPDGDYASPREVGPITLDSTVADARATLHELLEHGLTCPVCDQFAKVYLRKIAVSSAQALIKLYKACGKTFGHLPTVLDNRRADEAKMAYWGLIEEERHLRADGGRAGWWRVTDFGEMWLRGDTAVPKYARVYAGGCLGLTGEPVTIHEALGETFDFAELMNLRTEHVA